MNRLVGFSEVLKLNAFLQCIQQSAFNCNRYFYYTASKPKNNFLQSLDLLLAQDYRQKKKTTTTKTKTKKNSVAVRASLTVEDFSLISWFNLLFSFSFFNVQPTIFDIED